MGAERITRVAGALLFTRSLQNLANVDVGFEPDGLVHASVDLRSLGASGPALTELFERLAARVAAVPGVERASTAFIVPMSGSGWNQRVMIDGVEQESLSNFNQVGPTFFKTIGTPLVAGRSFDERDRVGAPRVAIVNETFARKFLSGRSPVGATFHSPRWASRRHRPPGARSPTPGFDSTPRTRRS